MEHTRNGISTSGNLYTVNDMTPETVMSELHSNLFRTTTSDWNLSASQVAASYSNNVASNSHGGPHSPSGSLQSTSTLKSEDHSDKSSSTLSNGEVFSEAFHNAEFPMSPQSGSESRPSTSGNNSQGDEADGMPPRKKRNPVPAEKKDAKYWDRRKKNNEAAKRSRDLRRKKMEDELKVAKEAMQENQKLKQEIDVLKAEINSLRRLLKDANMTLSLWIRARQASEPTAQLPPMLRGSNVSFVNFPVSSGI